MKYLEVLDRIKTHISAQFHAHMDDRLIYHNLYHTEQVVKNTVKIANHYQLGDEDFFVVTAAAWFHDLGYLVEWKHHEDKGAEAAASFLNQLGVDSVLIEKVNACIIATRMPQQPHNLLEQIVCDADLYHLGSESFKERNKTMRKEAEAFCGKNIEKGTWRDKTILLFEAHHYHTDFAQQQLNDGKARNLQQLKDKAAAKEKDVQTEAAVSPAVIEKIEIPVKKEKEKKKDNDRPEKGIETMFRITSGNNQRLSDMADNKAHIMIQTNSIILSVILSILLRKLEDNPHLIAPTLLLLIICVTTMVFCILATRPSVPPGTFSQDELQAKKVNLLFFGNFYRMDLASYEAGMGALMEDKPFLYSTLIKDVYGQGVVLGRKYRLLRAGYNVFMFGIVTAVLAFIVAMAFAM
ncbi:DUF5706 domain-containing protein [Pedobacter sp. MC2016-14]|uniref:Pycsar system effector family protein n=1 Tax=Pedobacter sp. MC2016-14 TaxID=2897327 RepID=UPI001E601565|nr:Pycsar system effector family protein [Pedobacter sp. MC2016-14]MCD0488669.1 DUF5706 domain-containing protein [Pedobacter sp. MC2016-14]